MEELDVISPQKYERPGKYFSDKGNYQVVGENGVEKGKFEVDTCIAEQAGGQLEWESLLNIYPENGVVEVDEEDLSVPNVYKGQGEVFRLWEVESDPTGAMAKLVHEKIIELVRRNTPAEEAIAEVRLFRNQLATKSEKPKLASG